MPPCIETKILLSGEIQRYECELVYFDNRFGMLKYTVDRHYKVNGIKLYPGDVTYALYWVDRPYTLYTWRLNRREGALYYFNIADRISLRPDEFTWRDLIVDILADGARDVHVLDEGELPQTLSPGLLHYIERAKVHLMSSYEKVIFEAETLLNAHGVSR